MTERTLLKFLLSSVALWKHGHKIVSILLAPFSQSEDEKYL